MRKNKLFKKALVMCMVASMVIASGCASKSNSSSTSSKSSNSSKSTAQSDATDSSDDSGVTATSTATTTVTSKIDEKDANDNWESEDYITISLDGDEVSLDKETEGVSVSDGIITITQAGTYVFEGNLSEGQIQVEAKDAKVWIVLKGVSITNSSSAAIYVKDAKKTIITAADGTTNTLTDATSYTYDDVENEEPNACIFSKDDLVVNGSGKIQVNAQFNNGISSSNDLIIYEIELEISAVNTAIRGKDCVCVKDANITITACTAGIKSTNTEEDGLGYIYLESGDYNITSKEDALNAATALVIDDGNYTINAGDDGIHSDYYLIINGGEITIESSVEGIEARDMTVNGGNIEVHSSDDGINATSGTTSSSDGGFGKQGGSMFADDGSLITINDGNILIDADGDGFDCNGAATMNGGCLIVYGPTNNGNGAIDYNGSFDINGGTVFASGSTGMAETASDTSGQCAFNYFSDASVAAGSTVSILDADGNTLFETEISKVAGSIVFSSSDLKDGETYTICVDGSEEGSITLSGTITSNGSASMGGQGMGGPMSGGGQGSHQGGPR